MNKEICKLLSELCDELANHCNEKAEYTLGRSWNYSKGKKESAEEFKDKSKIFMKFAEELKWTVAEKYIIMGKKDY